MPTFTAVALDTLIQPGGTKPMESKLERSNSSPSSRLERNYKLERGVSVPPSLNLEKGVNIPPRPKVVKSNGAPAPTGTVVDRKHHWTQISPALYATPESTPLPDSPSSFPPSPYIINHKRRGPRLMKSCSEIDVVICEQAANEIAVDKNGGVTEKELASVAKDDNLIQREVVDDNCFTTSSGESETKYLNGIGDEKSESNGSAAHSGVSKTVAFDMQQDDDDGIDEFVDPQDSMSIKSFSESESFAGVERSLNSTTPFAEFYDAWEELSSETPQHLMPDLENELRETRLSLLTEIEKRKQAEETLNNMRNQWQRIREQLSLVGVTLPADPVTLPEGNQPADPASEVLQQVYLARFVSHSIGRGIGKAEVEIEMEAQINLKNSEIARLWDRLHYYEAVNQEMSQRNQEVVETARRIRQRRKRRQRWVWGSVATLVTLGSAAFAYSYFQSGKGSSSTSPSQAPKVVESQPK